METENIAELICELTRYCNLKEEYFAASFNLSPAEMRLLKSFAVSPTISIKELCAIQKLTPGRITQIISSLEKKRLIVRTISPEDKRNVIVSVIHSGETFIANLYKSYADLNSGILSKVDPEQHGEILSSLQALVGVFRESMEKYKLYGIK